VIVIGAVHTTQRQVAVPPVQEIERVAIAVARQEPEVPAADNSPIETGASRNSPAAPPLSIQPINIPIEIPSTLPGVDLTKPVTSDLFARRSAGSGPAGSGNGLNSAPGTAGAYRIADVDHVARIRDGGVEPEYPSMLKRAGITGGVLLQFVVDTTGKADLNTLKFVTSDHLLFSESAKKALQKMRFIPAMIGQRPVRMWVTLPFEFTLKK
jgi:protein TonB